MDEKHFSKDILKFQIHLNISAVGTGNTDIVWNAWNTIQIPNYQMRIWSTLRFSKLQFLFSPVNFIHWKQSYERSEIPKVFFLFYIVPSLVNK